VVKVRNDPCIVQDNLQQEFTTCCNFYSLKLKIQNHMDQELEQHEFNVSGKPFILTKIKIFSQNL